MTNIYERLILKCPYVRARDYLRQMLESAAQKNEPRKLTLKAPVPLIPGDLEKVVVVRFERGSDPMHFDEPWQVRWSPEGGGPYPDFAGQITVRADESYSNAILELRGEYVPPLGPLGRAFDVVAGSKIAAATARVLLASIGDDMEAKYREEEAEKCSHTS